MNVIMYADEGELLLEVLPDRGARSPWPTAATASPTSIWRCRRGTPRRPPRCGSAASAPASDCPTSGATATSSRSTRRSARARPCATRCAFRPEAGGSRHGAGRPHHRSIRHAASAAWPARRPARRAPSACADRLAELQPGAVHRLRRLRRGVPVRRRARPDLRRRPTCKRFKHTVAIPSMTLYGQFGRDVHPAQVLHALTPRRVRQRLRHVVDVRDARPGHRRPPLRVTAAPGRRSPSPARRSCGWSRSATPSCCRTCCRSRRRASWPPSCSAAGSPRSAGSHPSEIGIFFITPCTAIMNSIVHPVGLDDSYIDGAFGITELYGPLLQGASSRTAAWTPTRASARPACVGHGRRRDRRRCATPTR